MEIHEPFSDLEKQISNILDQLDKQEPLSTAACKQVVAGLEKIKEYQINPSPKSKKEKIPTMDVKSMISSAVFTKQRMTRNNSFKASLL